MSHVCIDLLIIEVISYEKLQNNLHFLLLVLQVSLYDTIVIKDVADFILGFVNTCELVAINLNIN